MRAPLRIGAVGFGYWGPNLVRNLDRLAVTDLVAICDASEANRAKAAVAYPHVQVVGDMADLLALDIDAVVIATSAPSHHALAAMAIEAGKHTFVEKPLTLTSADAADLVKRAQERGVTLMVGHLMLYHAAIEWIRDYIDSGELGDVLYLYLQRLNLGKVRTEENAFWSLAPHDVSMALHLLGEVPTSVSASGADYLHDGVEDVVFANLHFASGKVVNIHVSWLDPHKTRKMTIVGTKKMLVFDDMESTEKIWIYDKGVAPTEALAYGEDLTLRFGDITVPFLKMSEPLGAELTHFVQYVHGEVTPRSSGRDGLAVVRVLEAVDESIAAGGAPVKIALEI
jgi:predicted dehydrogenase